jgi:predicted acetyltransferase
VDIELRPGTADDLPAIARVDGISFGLGYTEQDLVEIANREINFTVATERGSVVGVSGDFRFEMTVPGGATLPVPGVTWVSVLPTHRRRGFLTAMMRRLLEGYAAAGDSCAILTASEGGIYRRFGYGMATQNVHVTIDRRLTSLRNPVDASAVEFVSADAARTRLPELHERWQRERPGALSRDQKWWNVLMLDPENQRRGFTERQYLVHPGGYVAYRVGENADQSLPRGRCVITDYKISTPQAHAAIWQVLLGLDLFASIESWELPLDDPLPLMITDPRQLQAVGLKDGLWLRPIDVPTLLSTRRYQVEVEAVLEVAGERFALSGGPSGAECSRTDRPAAVVLDQPALASLFLGGFRVNTLARGGQLSCADPVLLGRLDLAFSAELAPAYGTNF